MIILKSPCLLKLTDPPVIIIVMDIFKTRYGHYYDQCALDEMTGVEGHTPTYECVSTEVRTYYRSLIDKFCQLAWGSPGSCIYKNEGWRQSRNGDWSHGVQPPHIHFLMCIKRGDIAGLQRINNEGFYIAYYKDCMLRAAIDSEQIGSLDYLIRSRQMNRNIHDYLGKVRPSFFDKLVDKYHIKFCQSDDSSHATPAHQLYLFFSNLHWLDPEKVYMDLKYISKPGFPGCPLLHESRYSNPQLLRHITEVYEINEKDVCAWVKKNWSDRYIYYCLRNNQLSELKHYFETEYENQDQTWSHSMVYDLVTACAHYQCLDVLDSLRVEKITCEKHEQHLKANLEFYKREIQDAHGEDHVLMNLIKQKLDTVFSDFNSIFDKETNTQDPVICESRSQIVHISKIDP